MYSWTLASVFEVAYVSPEWYWRTRSLAGPSSVASCSIACAADGQKCHHSPVNISASTTIEFICAVGIVVVDVVDVVWVEVVVVLVVVLVVVEEPLCVVVVVVIVTVLTFVVAGEVIVDVVSNVVVALSRQDESSITTASSTLKPNQMTLFLTIYLSFNQNDFAAILTALITPVNYVLVLSDFVTVYLLRENIIM